MNYLAGITKIKDTTIKQGYTYAFDVVINGRKVFIKKSYKLNKLVLYAIDWRIKHKCLY